MPDCTNKLDAESFQIVPWRKAIEDLDIAVVAGGTSEMKYPQRFFKTITTQSQLLSFYRLIIDNPIATRAERLIQMKKNLIA